MLHLGRRAEVCWFCRVILRSGGDGPKRPPAGTESSCGDVVPAFVLGAGFEYSYVDVRAQSGP